MIYFIADTHFGDASFIPFDQRPFKDLNEMDTTIIKNCNDVVTDDDTLIINGDFAIPGENTVKHIANQLNGKKILVRGNHDTLDEEVYTSCGIKVIDYPIILDEFYIVSHYPMHINPAGPYVNIFAHVHGNPMYKTVSSRSFCTSCSRIAYAPVSFNTVKRMINDQFKREIDNGC